MPIIQGMIAGTLVSYGIATITALLICLATNTYTSDLFCCYTNLTWVYGLGGDSCAKSVP